MSNQEFECQLPLGRITSGHPMKLEQTKNFTTGQPEFKQDGTPKMECYFQVAVPKNSEGLDVVWGAFLSAARRQQLDINGPFAWKLTDGDGQRKNDRTGQMEPYPEYCRGNWLFNIKSHGWCASVVRRTETGTYVEIENPAQIKTGDYVRVALRVSHNGQTGHQEGLYVNPTLVALHSIGDAISGKGYGANDAERLFGEMPAVAPAAPVAAPAPAAPAAPVAPNPAITTPQA
ncbi:MAG: hypothetical protein MI756_01125 [Chromatiales bacterium]|nr:hypothetical protein [Chromatiales bacterium]